MCKSRDWFWTHSLHQRLLCYRSGTVNLNTVNSKFHLIRSYCEVFSYHLPNISCLKCTVNSNFHLIRSKTSLTNVFELTVPNLYWQNDKFDGDANADAKCKVAFSPRGTHERRSVFPPSCPSRCSSRDTRTCSRQSCSVPQYTRCLETGLRTGLRHKHLKIWRHQCNSHDTGWFMTSLMYLTGVASN